MNLVEAFKYQVPQNTPDSLKDRGKDRILVDEVATLSQQLGFRRYGGPGYTVVCGISWQNFENPHLAIPNFPDGETVVHVMLALTPQEDSAESSEYPYGHAVLRVSKNDFEPYEFNRGITAFTNNFLRRPKVWGFPSRLMTERKFYLPAIAAGIVLGGIVGFWVNVEGRTFESAGFGALTGELTTGFGAPLLGDFAEKLAVRQISHPENIFIGEAAKDTLVNMQNHMLITLMQRELYAALLQDHPDLSPQSFWQKVYSNLPRPLIARRWAELLTVRLPGEVQPQEIGNSIPSLVQVGNLLLAAA